MRNVLIRKGLVVGIIFLFIGVGVYPAVAVESESSLNFIDENDAEVPIWNVGHSWTYDVTINGGLSPYLSINNFKMNNLKLTVEEVLDDSYILSFSADLTGSGSVKLDVITLSGQLKDTEMEGTMIVDESKLTVNELSDLIVDGYIKPNLLPKIPFNVEGDCFFTHGTPLLNFPINNYETWYVDETILDFDLVVNLLPDPIHQSTYVEGFFAECHEWDIVNVPAGEYDALKIVSELGDEYLVWYSVAAGNIIKVKGRDIPLSWGYLGEYDFDIVLKSTNFQIDSRHPSVPTFLSGPSEVVVGYPEAFTAGGSIDPDGDMIRYIFDWGDGTITGSDFVESGEDATVYYYWTQKGEYSIKVKARDKYGAESGWSDPITVTVLNDPPLKPDPPTGPTSGKIKTPHTYSATSTDPDGHRIRYKFDWGDGKTSTTQLVNSGETGSATHSWTRKGTYQIKVKAIDEYSEESEWSDPLTVTMPRNKAITSSLFMRFLEQFPILRYMLGL